MQLAESKFDLHNFLLTPPKTLWHLHWYVSYVLNLNVPFLPLTPGSTAPFTYLAHAYFGSQRHTADAVVWANRGGGKTMLGAVATLLDMLFKPGIEVCVMAGSLEQGSRMHEHLCCLLENTLLSMCDDLLASRPTRKRVELRNGSRVEVLSASEASVRGTRVQRLRCDEVDEIKPGLWSAAQMVTRSSYCGEHFVPGGVESLSTMHRPHGLMSKVIGNAGRWTKKDVTRKAKGIAASATPQAAGAGPGEVTPVLFRWTAMDVIERCPQERVCDVCPLWDECEGRAKHAMGFLPVDDLIAQRRRVDQATWDAEMMCRRPSVSACVYPMFDPAVHVREFDDISLDLRWIGGMDFGIRNETVWLLAAVRGSGVEATVHIVDEYVARGGTIHGHLSAIEAQCQRRTWPQPDWLGVDPAGAALNNHSGHSDVGLLRQRGMVVRTRRSRIRDGISLIRRRFEQRTLFIHPRCSRLIVSLQGYHFDEKHEASDEPIKDGHDHACDALRYMLVNLEGGGAVVMRAY